MIKLHHPDFKVYLGINTHLKKVVTLHRKEGDELIHIWYYTNKSDLPSVKEIEEMIIKDDLDRVYSNQEKGNKFEISRRLYQQLLFQSDKENRFNLVVERQLIVVNNQYFVQNL